MTTIVRTVAHRREIPNTSLVPTYKLGMGTTLLILAVLFSGLLVIYIADLNRRLLIEIEASRTNQNQIHLEWGKFLLEQTTWSSQARIQNIALEELGMQTPQNNQVVMLKLAAN